jgi:type VI secretion system secreted protein VgrG
MAVTTPLGKDVLLLENISGSEGISRLFQFKLGMFAEAQNKITFDQILGQKVTVQLGTTGGGPPRYFNGIISRFSQGHRQQGLEQKATLIYYEATLVPKFWLLTRNVQSRIFQHLTVPDILKQVLAGLDVSFEIQGTFHPRDYCVQYRESDFAFASRLMEEEGIYYFFRHAASDHKMVVANTPQSHPEVPGAARIEYDEIRGGVRQEERINGWFKSQEIRSGKETLWDHSFELPNDNLQATQPILETVAAGTVAHRLKTGGNEKLEVYDYPGRYALRFDGVDAGGGDRNGELKRVFEDNKRTVALRMQEEAAAGLVIEGESDCRPLVSGHKFTLTKHYNADGPYVLTEVHHQASVEGAYTSGPRKGMVYRNTFKCIPCSLPFRPARVTPKARVEGSQTAVVVGPEGEEIFTDKYGRVKVQFFWDRQGKKNADSSCWIRVTQPWAGKRWGASFWPRIGQEVIVDFMEGDPDQPIIVGTAYNADQMPPYLGKGLDSKHSSDNKLSGIKSNSTPGGTGFNEWRFDDTKGKEQVFLHAERDLDIRAKNDQRERILHDRHLIVGWEKDGKKGGDQREMIYQDNHLNVQRDQVEKIEGNVHYTVGKGNADHGGSEDIVLEKTKKEFIGADDHLHVKGNQLLLVDGGQDITVKDHKKETIQAASHLHVTDNRNEKVDGTQSLIVGQNQQEKVGQNHALEAGMEIHLKAGMKVILEAGMQLTIKAAGGFIDIGPAGVTIQGTMVLINSGGSAGSGSGSSPTAPEDAKLPEDAEEAKPTRPDTADDSVSGTKSAPTS